MHESMVGPEVTNATGTSHWFRHVQESLWHELCVPCVRRELAQRGTVVDGEADLFWQSLTAEYRQLAVEHFAGVLFERLQEDSTMAMFEVQIRLPPHLLGVRAEVKSATG